MINMRLLFDILIRWYNLYEINFTKDDAMKYEMRKCMLNEELNDKWEPVE